MKCPACAETIDDGTLHCPFCHGDITTAERDLVEERLARGTRKVRRASQPVRLMSILGTTGLVLALFLVLVWLASLILPGMERARFASRRDAQQHECEGNLRRIARALQVYHEVHGSFPPAVTYSGDGQPMHSWRVLILPHLEGLESRVNYNLNEPWNSPGNRQATLMTPAVFRCPGNDNGASFGTTHYVAIDGPQSVMNSQQPARLPDIVDGAGATIVIVEGRDPAMHWAEPKDLDIRQATSFAPNGLSSNHSDGFHAVLADGTIRMLYYQNVSRGLPGLMTIDGGEVVEGF